MPDLPARKVGIISCSGEEIPEGTISRVATRLVLEELRPAQTVTLCLPLFLAGGKEERAFARFYPTVAVDGCPKLCAAKATAAYSAEPAARVVVSEIVAAHPELKAASRRRLGDGGKRLARLVAEEVAARVDAILRQPAQAGVVRLGLGEARPAAAPAVACACQGGGLPAGTIVVAGKPVTVVALEPIFERFRSADTSSGEKLENEMLQMVKVYNAVPPELEAAYAEALWQAFAVYCKRGSV